MAAKKKTTTKKPRKSRVDKPFNDGTMSTSAFFGMLRSALRRKSMYWKPIFKVRKAAQIPYIGPNKRRKYSYVCQSCKGVFSDKECAVHHINEVGTLTCFEDLPNFVRNLFCEEEGLILICNGCHDKVHNKNQK